MPRFLVKWFGAQGTYSYVEADTLLAAAEAFTGRKLTHQPSGDAVALVQTVVNEVVMTLPLYAARIERPDIGKQADSMSLTQEAVVDWCKEERDQLASEIKEIEAGGLRVQRITNGRGIDITATYLIDRRASLVRLSNAIDVMGSGKS